MTGTKRVAVCVGIAGLLTSFGLVVEPAARSVPRITVIGKAGSRVDTQASNPVTTISGELLEKSPLTGRDFDQLILTLPQPREVKPVKLSEGWQMEQTGRNVRMYGPACNKVRFRLSIDGNWANDYLGKDLTFQSSYQGARDEPLKIKIDLWPSVNVTPNLDNILTVPPQAAPGQPLLIGVAGAYRDRDGSWLLRGPGSNSSPLLPLEDINKIEVLRGPQSALYGWSKTDAYVQMMTKPDPRPFVTEYPTMGEFDRVQYRDPWGDLAVDAPISITPATPQSGGRRLDGGSPLNFAGQAACVKGNFPTFGDAYGMRLDMNVPLTPWGASSTTVMLGIPENIAPGTHTISDGNTTITITVLTVEGNIDRNKLWRGESTTMRLRVLGTDKPFPLAILNATPGTITIAGGVRQVVTTPGGADNAITRSVTGIQKGDFSIVYSVNAPGCGG